MNKIQDDHLSNQEKNLIAMGAAMGAGRPFSIAEGTGTRPDDRSDPDERIPGQNGPEKCRDLF